MSKNQQFSSKKLDFIFESASLGNWLFLTMPLYCILTAAKIKPMPPSPGRRTSRNKLKPRKSPSQQRSQETVEAIVEAAAHILEKRGLEGYTTNAVAERAGVSIGSLYQYFPNKDALTVALLERESQKMLDAMAVIDPTADFASCLDTMLMAAVDHQLDRPILARLLDIEEMRFPQSAKLVAKNQMVRELIVTVLRRANYRFVEDDDQIAEDLIAITRCITDAAGQRGELDKAQLLRRVKRAVEGYIMQSKTTQD